MEKVLKLSKKPEFIFLSILILCFSVELMSPIVFYGMQLFGVFCLLVYRFFIFQKINIYYLVSGAILVLVLEGLMLLQSTYLSVEPVFFLMYQKIIFYIFFIFLMFDFIKEVELEVLKKAVNYHIVFLAFFVFFQFFGYYFLGLSKEFVDVAVWIGGEPSRNGYTEDVGYRPTSLMSEPSIFVGVQFALIVLNYILDKKQNIYRLVGILSLSLSLSFLGLMLSGLFLLIVYSRRLVDYFFMILFGSIFLVLAHDFIEERINRFQDGGDGSNNVKIETVRFFFSDELMLLFGYGYLPSTENAPLFYQALRDLTFYLNAFTVFGLILGSFFIFLFFYFLLNSKFDFKEKLLIMLVFVKLSNPAVIFFSCFILLLIAINERRRLI